MSFKRLDAEDFVVSADAVQSVAWSTGLPELTSFFTSSAQKTGTTGNFYLSVYQVAGELDEAEVQFDIAYANQNGSGSTAYNAEYPNLSPSSTTYGQYRTMILEDENSVFVTGPGSTGGSSLSSLVTSSNAVIMDNFWALSIERARYKQSIFPGTLSITLSGSNGEIQLTDNSNDISVQNFLGSTRVLQLVSGSNGSGTGGNGGYTINSGSYGLVFPDIGTILLNAPAVVDATGISIDNGSSVTNGSNQSALFNAISDGGAFTMNSTETVTSDYIFIRSRNSEFNYSENPSFISGSDGSILFPTFINNPQVFATTVGMYNDANELLAVAKLSRPLLKDFTKESLVRVKLDF